MGERCGGVLPEFFRQEISNWHSLAVLSVEPVGQDGLVVVPELVDDRSVRLLVLEGQVRLGLGRHPPLGLLERDSHVRGEFTID